MMTARRRLIQNVKNQKGQITLDFLFGCVLIMGVSAILGALTFALTLTEVLQYVSFSAARNYFAGDVSPDLQTQAAQNKAASLLKSLPFLQGATSAGWITIGKQGADNYSDIGNGYEPSLGVPADGSQAVRRDQFTGYQISFTLPILNIQLPLLGQVMTPPDGDSFKGTVSSFLMREPSTNECIQYNKQIYNLIQSHYSGGSAGGGSGFVAIIDNGC